ncbi:hypothetical protein [Granulicella mallensis]|uniref:Uncharacterized protein n=1 Tax=Granulicella mallensis (strain ATCC BAA-1857 / DSM 23137 / MP5ACTX8) TaxID=682795 RepID=G8NP85_GRAMM|nr:hypothetical protein [Granulicella mallensis]AEU38284.1 hypothetical protein AciX8_4001 [Granulicella mallensis MP5ACTX8]
MPNITFKGKLHCPDAEASKVLLLSIPSGEESLEEPIESLPVNSDRFDGTGHNPKKILQGTSLLSQLSLVHAVILEQIHRSTFGILAVQHEINVLCHGAEL